LKVELEIAVKEASYFIGIEIKQEADRSIKISQPAYARKILERFKLENCRVLANDSAESGKVDTCFPTDKLLEL